MPPLTVMVKPVSGLCNLRCSYCFYADVAGHRKTASYGVMTEATLQNLVRRAFAYAEGQVNFAFQGGEPTLAGKDFYRRWIALEKKMNTRHIAVSHAIQTNGYMLDEAWCDIFQEGQFLVGVSIDGTKALHDTYRRTAVNEPTYERIQTNLALLRREKVDYNVLCVVNQPVAERPKEVFETLREHVYMQFIPCLDGLDGEKSEFSLRSETYGTFLVETFDLYERAYNAGKPVSIRTFDNWLGMLVGYPPESCAMAGRCGQYYLIEADGGAYPCDFYVLDAWRMGNINDSSFFKLEKSPVAEAFRRQSIPLPEACAKCKWLPLCRGGCKREREPIIDGVPSGNRLCDGLKMFFEQRSDRMRRLAKRVYSRAMEGIGPLGAG